MMIVKGVIIITADMKTLKILGEHLNNLILYRRTAIQFIIGYIIITTKVHSGKSILINYK